MHIKQIIIQGFKSYKEQTVIEPFSAGLNVIVGRNGSGKSNFFAAIRFVLSDAYGQMGREERQALLHEGSGSAVMSAYVEVIFDNSDERFPNGKPELVLRRTIGMKKDEYTLDRKSSTKAEVMNMLESAGFSRSNPYYIVPQGRVTHITNMKDTDRLTLLKEVAGTQVYEARRTESLKIMQETENKRSKIDDLLTYIEVRLAQLEEEKEELRKYQDKDREHRCLQYTIYHREQVEIQRHLMDIDERREAGVGETDTNRTAMEDIEQHLNKLETAMVEARQNLDYHMLERQQLDDERKETRREKAKIESDVQSLTAGQSAAQQAKAQHDQELYEVQHLIQERERQLAALLPAFNSTRANENNIKADLEQAIATRHRLFAKQGRSEQFKSKKERDLFLRKEINDLNVQLAARKAVLGQTDDEIAMLETEIGGLETTIVEVHSRIEDRGGSLESLASETEKAKELRDQLQDRRRVLWRTQNELESRRRAAEADLENAQYALQRKVDRTMWQGIQSVRRIKAEHGIEGIYGTLGELFEVGEMYETAVEVTAGQSLFHYVVDNDETVSKVLEILNKQKGGRVTFMPLNRLNPRPINMPKLSDAVPMLSKVKYDDEYGKAFEQVFGKAVICPSIGVATQCARSHGVSAITPNGDRADKKGSLTGGWYDTTKSSLKAIRREAKCRQELEALRLQYRQVEVELRSLEQEITKAVSDVQKLEQRTAQMDNSYTPMRQELMSLSTVLQRRRDELESRRIAKDNIALEQRKLSEEQFANETELSSEFKKNLSPEEEQQLELLGSRVQQLRRQLSQLSMERSELENQKVLLEVELRENLRRRLDQLNSQEAESGSYGIASAANTSTRLKDRQRALKRIDKILDDLAAKYEQADQAVEQATLRLASLQGEKAEKQHKQEELSRLIEHHQKRMEKNMQKKAMLNEKLIDCNRSIRDLGVLPEEAFKKYEKLDSDKVRDPVS
jgi:structural maintenance of chromosome 3 (chondroitin sulfate proteoglycan 6)